MEYELWSAQTDRQIGYVDVPQHVDQYVGSRVSLKVMGTINHPQYGSFNAVAALVFKMRDRKTHKTYWALETMLPVKLARHLEGFRPHIEMPSLMDIFHFGGRSKT